MADGAEASDAEPDERSGIITMGMQQSVACWAELTSVDTPVVTLLFRDGDNVVKQMVLSQLGTYLDAEHVKSPCQRRSLAKAQ